VAQLFLWSLRVFTGLAALAAGAVGLAYLFAARSLPDYDAARAVRGLGAPVEIVRDTANVPHVFGESDADVFFGLGYAHAQDRLWQMVTLRRAAQGRLSEVFGPRTLARDELMRRLDIYRAAVDSVAAQEPQARAALAAYAAGVNARIDDINAGARGRGAPEFFLFSREVAPWQPADSIAVLKYLAWAATEHPQAEVLRARAALRLPAARLRDLMPDIPPTGPATAPQRPPSAPPPAPLPADALPALPLVDERIGPAPPAAAQGLPDGPGLPDRATIPPLRRGGASNAFAAAPARSAAGGSLLANDPHVPLTAPGLFYLARLELASGGVIGATIPGLPLVVAGRSARLGWAITTAWVDDADLYMEELNPADPTQVRTSRGWQDMRTERTILRVADAAPVTLTLRWSDNGAVLPGTALGLAEVTPAGHVAALAWTGADRADTSISAGLALMRAGDVEAAMTAGAGFVAPAQVLTLVDDTRIAAQVVGALPDRDPDHAGQGRIPALGWVETNRWRGLRDTDRAPRFRDPGSGVLGTTNNRLTDRPFPDHLSHLWGDSQRIQRLRRLLADREVHTRDSFVAVQLDTVSVSARGLLPLIARELWFSNEAAEPGTPEHRRQRALALLADWNGEMNEHLPEPLIYAAWMRQLQWRLISDELGPLAQAFARPDPVFIERVFRDIGGASVWCDIAQSTRVEDCTGVARLALDEALIELAGPRGDGLEALRWGDAHEALHRHPVLGDVPVLKWLVNIRQSTSGGDHTLMTGGMTGATLEGAAGGAGGRPGAPFLNVRGAGYRGVYDFRDPDSSVFVIATGQSGHPLSRHYDDLGVLWRRGEYVPMSLDPDLARAGALGVTRLSPAP